MPGTTRPRSDLSAQNALRIGLPPAGVGEQLDLWRRNNKGEHRAANQFDDSDPRECRGPLLLPPLHAAGDNAAMEAEPIKPEPKRKRRWFQFSLRTLMIFTLICAIGAAWLAPKIERKRQEQNAVDAISRIGGAVSYDLYKSEPSGPVWLRNLLGENFFSEVVSVAFDWRPSELGDAELANLDRLTSLKDLNIRGCNVTAAGMAHVKGLSQLVWLDLQRTNVSDSDLVNLKGLAKLQDLNLEKTRVTNAGVNDLQKALPNCTISR
jgi:hypothetical protein